MRRILGCVIFGFVTLLTGSSFADKNADDIAPTSVIVKLPALTVGANQCEQGSRISISRSA
jgi:hypothetical protein